MAPLPLREDCLELFVASVSRRVRADTIRCYLSGVQFYSHMSGFSDKISRMCRLYYLVRGIKRSEGRSPRLPRHPIRLKHLYQLHKFIDHKFNSFDRAMYKAVIALAFFGMLRCSEYTAPGRWVWDPDTNLARDDVVFKKGGVVVVTIKASKTDPFRDGARVSLVKTHCPFCPVSAMHKFCSLRGDFPGPLFLLSDGSYFTKSDMAQLLLGCFKLDKGFSSHSFRIGGATAAAKAGVPAHIIQLLGRWRSDAFKKYVRISPRYFAHWSRAYGKLFSCQMEYLRKKSW